MKEDTYLNIIAVIILLAAILGFAALYGHAVYGDWTCGFAHCVVVK